MVKTLVLFELIPDESYFFELEGDYSRFNGVYINMNAPKGVDKEEHEKLSNELNDVMYDKNGNNRVTDALKLKAPTKDWTHFVKCGMFG